MPGRRHLTGVGLACVWLESARGAMTMAWAQRAVNEGRTSRSTLGSRDGLQATGSDRRQGFSIVPNSLT